MNGILQGTTPSLTITIPEEISVSSITALELAFKQMASVTLLHMADVSMMQRQTPSHMPLRRHRLSLSFRQLRSCGS